MLFENNGEAVPKEADLVPLSGLLLILILN